MDEGLRGELLSMTEIYAPTPSHCIYFSNVTELDIRSYCEFGGFGGRPPWTIQIGWKSFKPCVCLLFEISTSASIPRWEMNLNTWRLAPFIVARQHSGYPVTVHLLL
jgi:hypothetical protein